MALRQENQALDYLEQAATQQYKINQTWKQTSKACVTIAKIYQNRKDYSTSARNFRTAGLCLAPIDEVETEKLFHYSFQLYTNKCEPGSLVSGDKQTNIHLWKRSASQLHDQMDALDHYIACFTHLANLHAEEHQYDKACNIYEHCAKICSKKNYKETIKEHFFKSLLCQFAISAKNLNSQQDYLNDLHLMMTRFENMYCRFVGTLEHTLIQSTSRAFENKDIQKYIQLIHAHHQTQKLDDLTAEIFLEIKIILMGAIESSELS
jgi:tetratricopeptide (TPR) repeat protein